MRLLTLTTILILPTMALAQEPKPEDNKPKCIPRHTLPADSKEEHIMFSDDGDRWVLVTNIGTGEQVIGFIKLLSQEFCPADKGKPIGRRT